MATNGDLAGLRANRGGDDLQQVAGIARQRGCPERKHRKIGIVHEIDADALGGIHHPHLAHQPTKPLLFRDLAFDPLLDALDHRRPLARPPGRIAWDGQGLGARLAGSMRVTIDIGQRRAAQQPVSPRALFLGLDQRRSEIVGEPLALVLGGRTEQPKQQEEGHHRSDEIGISHFPGTAMVSRLDDRDLLDDDRNGIVASRLAGHVSGPARRRGVRSIPAAPRGRGPISPIPRPAAAGGRRAKR